MTDRLSVIAGSSDTIDEMMGTMNEAFDPAYSEAWTMAQSLSMLSLPGVWLSLARIDDRPAGFALNRIVVDEVELLLLAVRSSARRRGVGRLLIEHTIDASRTKNAVKVHLEVRHNNPAFHLYVNTGFMLVGRRMGYYHAKDGSSHDALTLSCALITN